MSRCGPTFRHASYSLQTTAGDYAKFMVAVLNGASLSEATRHQWLTPTVRVPRGDATHLKDSPPKTERDIGWGLGWGVEATDGTFFQWGKMDGIRAFAMGNPTTQSAVVLLTNSNRGLRLMDAAAVFLHVRKRPARRRNTTDHESFLCHRYDLQASSFIRRAYRRKPRGPVG
ncbi:serine hydrolase [Variovorax sp. LARHSF232]